MLTTGDGGGLMALADLESAVRSAGGRGMAVVWNDAAYSAEVHLYGLQGYADPPMRIPETDFAGLAAAVGAEGVVVRELSDLDRLATWAAEPVASRRFLLLDCRISGSVIAPYQHEIIAVNTRRLRRPLTDGRTGDPAARPEIVYDRSSIRRRSGAHVLDPSRIAAIADELADADRTRTTVPLLTARNPGMTVDDAYAVQREWADRAAAGGRRLVGRKIGLTSKVMQVATGITEPDYGVIFDDMVIESGASVEFDRFSNVRIEVELAFVLRDRLEGPNTTIFDVLDATAYVVPALEILNSHIELEGRTIVDTISDNAAMGAMVVGGTPVKPDAVDLRWVSALLSRNQVIEESGVAAAVLGHPAMGVAWLANKLAQHGQALEAGEIILAGSFTRPMWVERGDTVHADYRELGTVTCRFE